MKSKLTILVFLFLITTSSCTALKDQRTVPEVKDNIKKCREQWVYKDLTDTIEIKLLMFDKKGRWDLESWPNLFIGVTNKKDTIGIIDDFAKQDFKTGTMLYFAPYNNGSENDKKTAMLYPLFRVHEKKSENDLYCKVKTIYFGKLINK